MNMKQILITICLLTLVACSKADNLLNYQNSYIGDNSAISHILSLLPINLKVDTFSLQTTTEPYELTVNYTNDLLTEEDLSYSANILFALIQNVEIIHFKLKDTEFTFNRPSDDILKTIIEKELATIS